MRKLYSRVYMTNNGVVMREGFAARWLAEAGEEEGNKNKKKDQFRGRLMLDREICEVAENDGEFGRPRWVYYGDTVYDVTREWLVFHSLFLSLYLLPKLHQDVGSTLHRIGAYVR